jgi:hypothetical protein
MPLGFDVDEGLPGAGQAFIIVKSISIVRCGLLFAAERPRLIGPAA